ncbi:MAG: polyketide synthase dehydratase domain-containing protein, partial [Deltaproteobacteria bacterium]|nr:polyketide synthase dehydratase domain-containing protein [Deltaproteobacteria bacterium]
LEVLASGKISEVFGETFALQDDYPRQVRVPEAPLLLVDRVTGLDAPPGSMTKGTIWTETEIKPESWYLNDVQEMPAGLMVESGQSDLLLISWLGADFLNRGDRVYRLLGCDLSHHGQLARPGDRLEHDIHVDGHAKAGDTRIFFFHSDCRVDGDIRLSVRNAQAGFFTDEELRNSGGVLWDAASDSALADVDPAAQVDPPKVVCKRSHFDARKVRAFSEGRVAECFGPGFERALSHTRTPKIQSGPMLLLERVTAFEPGGGPWGRGYLRVENELSTHDWYLHGHFKNDPCMPGTLMAEGCLQAMTFFIAASGYTLDKDGWRFAPLPDQSYHLTCRGQVTPASKQLTYEVFVETLVAGPEPLIIADILGSADGLKIFHGRRMALQLVPDWPLTSRPELLAPIAERERDLEVARLNDFAFGYASLLACAWGRPSEAFGDLGALFDGTRHIARLPGPPYHFMSRVTHLTGPDGHEAELGGMKVGSTVEIDYDIPKAAWYFEENDTETMPFCVLLEAALQPCGWLAVFVGGPAQSDEDLYFRNLDGTGTVFREVGPESGTLRTRTTLTSLSRVGPMTLVSFDLTCSLKDGTPVYALKTGFGFFPREALAEQVGLPATDAERAWLHEANDFRVDLTQRPARYVAETPRLPGPMLLMIDAVTGYWPKDGPEGLGRLRSEKRVDPTEWFFKAHFYQDPVQPGSLGIEAMVQLLQFYMLHEGLAGDIAAPRFEPLATDHAMTWKYRGQVTPDKGLIRVEMNVLARGQDDTGAAFATAEAWLWVDDLRIYYANDLTVRIVSGVADTANTADTADTADTAAQRQRRVASPSLVETRFDPAEETWIRDHRPNYTRPTLPLMSLLDRSAGAALAHVEARYPTRDGDAPWQTIEVHNLTLAGWAIADAPFTLRAEVVPRRATASLATIDDVTCDVTLTLRRDGASDAGNDDTHDNVAHNDGAHPLCHAEIRCARQVTTPTPQAWGSPRDATAQADPYASGALFHGPALSQLVTLDMGTRGSSARLDAGASLAAGIPFGTLHQALLDAALHGIPHDDLQSWAPEVDPELLAYPLRVDTARFFGPAPREGLVRCEARLVGIEGAGHLARFEIRLIAGDGTRDPLRNDGFADEGVFAELLVTEALVPMGRQGRDRLARLTFLRDRQAIARVGLSTFDARYADNPAATTRVDAAEIRSKDWLPGSVAHAYGLNPDAYDLNDASALAALTAHVAAHDHLAQRAGVHPSAIHLAVADAPTTTDVDTRDTALANALATTLATLGESPLRLRATSPVLPLTTLAVEITRDDNTVTARDPEDLAAVAQDLTPLLASGRERLGLDRWAGEELTASLFRRFVRRVIVEDPAAYAAIARGRPALYLGNHQVQIESILFTLLGAALSNTHVVTIAKAAHESGWVGQLIRHLYSHPAIDAPDNIVYFDQADPRSMFGILERLGREVKEKGHSVFLHPEGDLAFAAGQPVTRLSSVFIDFALDHALPIVPVRFYGGLPVDALDHTLDFPWRYGQQDYLLGRPIAVEALRDLPYAARRDHILNALNTLGPALGNEEPLAPRADPPGHAPFADRVQQNEADNGHREAAAVITCALGEFPHPSDDVRRLLHGDIEADASSANDAETPWLAALSTWLLRPPPV